VIAADTAIERYPVLRLEKLAASDLDVAGAEFAVDSPLEEGRFEPSVPR
jgi:hypothetical protein